MICPGCREPMEYGGLVGFWIDEAGRFRGTYVLCPDCSDKAVYGNQAERDAITEAVEVELALAGASPSAAVH